LVAKTFYRLLKSVTSLELDNSSDFKVMTNDVILQLRRIKERNLFFRGVIDWVGFKKVQFPFEVEERTVGNSSFSTLKLVGLALNAILSYTSKPLYITIVSSLVFLVFAVILGVQTLYNYIIGVSVSGFSTVIVLLLIVGSMILMSMGIIGVYIARIYDEIKQRPKYIVHRYVGKKE
jgi:polyisoprenyl-phosphate glycosyltransferase